MANYKTRAAGIVKLRSETGFVTLHPRVELPVVSAEIWKQWNNPPDALLWAQKLLPQMSMTQLQQELNALPAIEGKKAPAWAARVNELILEQF